jgi:two-component system alkaline phosphatase synthesis response regulator PhoP
MADHSGKTILLVDDDLDLLTALEFQLKKLGFSTVSAQSQRDGERLIDAGSVDLAVFDLMLEHLDAGFTLCHRMKQRHPEVPVILLTGVTAETGIDFGNVTGEERSWVKADAMLAKPIRFEQLAREIDRLL